MKRISPHLCRGPDEPIDQKSRNRFYDRLLCRSLRQPAVRQGNWQLLDCVRWDGNWTWDCFLTFAMARPRRQSGCCDGDYASSPEPVLRPACVH